MAAVAPPADHAADLIQKLTLDSQSKTLEIPEPTKKAPNQNGSVDTGNAVNGQIQSYDSFLTEPTMCFVPNNYASPAYYYGGYDGTGGEWDNFPRYANGEGVDMASGFYGDNGSLMYHGYGFAPYAPYSPATSPVPGNDQLYGTQQYHYVSPYFQSTMTPTSAPFTPSAAPATELSTSAASDQKPLSVETVNVNTNSAANAAVGKGNRSAPLKTSNQNPSYNSNGSLGRGLLPGGVASGNQDPRLGLDAYRSLVAWSEGAVFSDGQLGPLSSAGEANSFRSHNNGHSRHQHFHPNSNFMGMHHTRPLSGMGVSNGYVNRMYPTKLYGQYGNTIRSGMGFGSGNYDLRMTGRGWLAVDKYRNRGHGNSPYGYANENADGLNELNRGPRAKGSKNQKGFTPVLAVKGQALPSNGTSDEEKNKASAIPDRDDYNKSDFSEDHEDSKFFIIKSYSEDDVHKSIKYNVWASTPNGNKKLDAAYREAQEKASGCPVFLFFSVNTSGQFVGLAEMVGPVDFHKSVEYWQQDKWNGCFPVKWHIVKDVPNSLLKHITLENNENKAVTNSRDTQEVKLSQGLMMIKIFKEHPIKTCLFDDFEFYDNRQKAIQEKKARQLQFQKPVWEGKPAVERKEMANGQLRQQKSLEVASEIAKEPMTAHANGDVKPVDGLTEKKIDDSKVTKPVASEKAASNGSVNSC